MTTCIGIDLAWGERGRTGLAVLDADGRLVASTSGVADPDIDAFLAPHLGAHVVAAIDAPLVVPNATGSRPCERDLGAVYRAHDAGAHPANRSRPYLEPPASRPGPARSDPARPSLTAGGTVTPADVHRDRH